MDWRLILSHVFLASLTCHDDVVESIGLKGNWKGDGGLLGGHGASSHGEHKGTVARHIYTLCIFRSRLWVHDMVATILYLLTWSPGI